MLQKGKILIIIFSAVVILYGVAAAFYEKVVAQDATLPAMNVFMDALRTIHRDYVEAPDMNKVQEGAMRGMIDALDPYSTYLTKSQVQALEDNPADRTADIGLVLSKRANILCVVSAERDRPAAKAGVRPGDYLVSVDGINVEDKSILETEAMLRGAPGSKVKAAFFRGAAVKPVEFELVRGVDVPAAVISRMLDGRIGLIEIPSLADQTLEQARVKLKTLISAGAQKLILDLRDCADGKPANGADLANLFMKEGSIYSIRGRDGGMMEEVKASPEKFVTDLPLAVLINASTAGPAEITAGALKAGGRAAIVGEKSFGVGSAQTRIQLQSGSVLFLSTAKFYTPDGKVIENDETFRDTGIKPNFEVPDQDRLQDLLVNAYFDAQDDAAKYLQLRDKVNQEQLEKAVEVLTKGLATQKRAA
jgi:carboxyl-terminal processing protease